MLLFGYVDVWLNLCLIMSMSDDIVIWLGWCVMFLSDYADIWFMSISDCVHVWLCTCRIVYMSDYVHIWLFPYLTMCITNYVAI